MTILTIGWKDVKKIFRNIFTLIMMFAAPFLITGLLYFAFGNMDSDTPTMEAVKLGYANNDSGTRYFDAGEQLKEYLQSLEHENIVIFTEVENEIRGKGRIETGELDVLVSIPENFSSSFNAGNPRIDLFTDPARTVQPALIESLVKDYVAALAGLNAYFQVLPRIGGGEAVDPEKAVEFAEDYMHRKEAAGQDEDGAGEARTMSMLTMCAMAIFFIFFAASVTAQTLISEREEGTFQRMRITPNGFGKLLSGKFTGVILTVTIQAIILFTGATFLFGISWSSIPALVLITLATIISAAGFTIFLMSLVDTTRQVGAISGGVLTLGGMLGGLFTVGVPNLPGFFNVVNKIVPQGWALSGYRALLLPEQPVLPLWISIAVSAGSGILFLTAGTVILNRKLR